MTYSRGHVLIVDVEAAIRAARSGALGPMGFEMQVCSSGEEALRLVRETQFDVVVLDVNMPGMGGIRTCRELRRGWPRLSILMLTVRDSEDDKVEALDAGADDDITKPFNLKELAARLRTSVRRSRTENAGPNAVLRIGDLVLDPPRRLLSKSGAPVHLTPTEFEVRRYLMAHAGMPVTHAKLLREVWGPEYGGELEYLRTFVRQLRKKIEDNPARPRYLLTDSHVGYRFADAETRTEHTADGASGTSLP